LIQSRPEARRPLKRNNIPKDNGSGNGADRKDRLVIAADAGLDGVMTLSSEEPVNAMMDPAESQVNLMHRISNIVASELSLDEMLGEIVGLTSQVTDCDATLVYLIEAETNEIVLRASQVPHARDLGNLRMKVGEGITGWVAEHQSVVALPRNAASDARFKRFSALVEDTYEAFLSVPLVNRGEIIGVVNVHHRQPHDHTPQEVSLLTFIGEQMGTAIAKSMLEDQNEMLREQLETRKIVERAKGLLQSRHGLSEEEAYLRLRNESRRLRRPMKELAEAIILSEELSRKPD
jgi:two-component system, response regulator PdtaR